VLASGNGQNVVAQNISSLIGCKSGLDYTDQDPLRLLPGSVPTMQDQYFPQQKGMRGQVEAHKDRDQGGSTMPHGLLDYHTHLERDPLILERLKHFLETARSRGGWKWDCQSTDTGSEATNRSWANLGPAGTAAPTLPSG